MSKGIEIKIKGDNKDAVAKIKEVEKKIKELKAAERLNNPNAFKGGVNGNISNVGQGVQQLTRSLGGLGGSLGSMTGLVGRFAGALNPVGLGITAAIASFKILQACVSRFNDIVERGRKNFNEYEKTKATLGAQVSYLAPNINVDAVTRRLQLMAANGVASVDQLAAAFRKLVPVCRGDSDEALKMVQRFHDIQAATGVSAETLAGLSMRVQEVGRATAKDVDIIDKQGIPVYQTLGKILGISADEAKEAVKKNGLAANEYKQVLEELGQVYKDTAQNISDTLEGSKATLEDKKGMAYQNATEADARIEKYSNWALSNHYENIAANKELQKEITKTADEMARLTGVMKVLGQSFSDAFDDVATTVTSGLTKSFAQLGSSINNGGIMSKALGGLIYATPLLGQPLYKGLTETGKAYDHANNNYDYYALDEIKKLRESNQKLYESFGFESFGDAGKIDNDDINKGKLSEALKAKMDEEQKLLETLMNGRTFEFLQSDTFDKFGGLDGLIDIFKEKGDFGLLDALEGVDLGGLNFNNLKETIHVLSEAVNVDGKYYGQFARTLAAINGYNLGGNWEKKYKEDQGGRKENEKAEEQAEADRKLQEQLAEEAAAAKAVFDKFNDHQNALDAAQYMKEMKDLLSRNMTPEEIVREDLLKPLTMEALRPLLGDDYTLDDIQKELVDLTKKGEAGKLTEEEQKRYETLYNAMETYEKAVISVTEAMNKEQTAIDARNDKIADLIERGENSDTYNSIKDEIQKLRDLFGSDREKLSDDDKSKWDELMKRAVMNMIENSKKPIQDYYDKMAQKGFDTEEHSEQTFSTGFEELKDVIVDSYEVMKDDNNDEELIKLQEKSNEIQEEIKSACQKFGITVQ